MPRSYSSTPLTSLLNERENRIGPDDGNVVTEWPRGPRPSAVNNNDSTGKRRSIGKRMVRAFARFFIAVLIGVGATLAWQSYSDEAIQMVRTEAPSLAWLLPVSTAKPHPDGQASAAAVVTSAELVQQLKPMAVDLDIVRRSVQQLANKVEQLAAKQDQMSHKQDQISQDITTLQLVEQEVSQKLSAPPQSAVPSRKPPQPSGQSSTVPPPPPSTRQR
jgi:TolA-binding protein